MRTRLDNFGTVNSENIIEKHKEIIDICNAIDDLINDHNKFMSEHVFFSDSKDTVKNLLAYFKKLCNDKERLNKIKELEKELNAMKKAPDNSADLFAALTRISRIKTSIPQIKAMLNKATTLKKIAEKVDDEFVKVFDDIIKDIEAADSVEKVVFAGNKLTNKENELKNLMRTKINEAKEMASQMLKLMSAVRMVNFKYNYLDVIDVNGYVDGPNKTLKDIYMLYQKVPAVKEVESRIRLWLGEQIATLKEQATRLKDMATGVDNTLAENFNKFIERLNGLKLTDDLQKITTGFNQVKDLVNERAKVLAPKLVEALEIDALLKNEVMGAEIQDELNAIKAGLPKADEANADTVVKAFDDVKAVKTKMANKLLEWHEVLSDYHNKGYHKEGNEQDVKIGLNQLSGQAKAMLDNKQNYYDLSATNLATATNLAHEIAENLRTDIADVIDTVKNYKGFRTTGFRLLGGIRIGDYTAAWQANTLVTFLRDSVVDVSDLKFVDKETRAKLAKNIKHIFDQIEIDQETGKYCLSPLYNRYAVNHDDLKLICEAYDVIAGDFGERVSYTPFVEGTTETTNRLSFRSMLSSFTGAKEQSQLINKTTHLINELKKVSRLDLLDVSPESRVVLKNDIMEIGAKIRSTPG